MKNSLTLALLVLLAGCQEYLVRSDMVSPYTGNAVITNQAQQTIDPWPRYVYDTNLKTSGKRQADAVRNYRNAHEESQAAAAVVVPAQQTSNSGSSTQQ
ncbi:hypothetical protein [Salaquimonas pukyongi]|uniref:hypothetical protein n=1 Tax=Salaquimonas pukyongi TaxID=2712698 RepID=UPI00096BA287|nr:hypothetical protein [Salaquimonas pukyongi]